MPATVKTHRNHRESQSGACILSFKPTTPRKIIAEARVRYAAWLENANDEDLTPIAEMTWYRQMSMEMTPARYLKTYREIAEYSPEKLEELVDVPASRISDYETGQRAISKEMAKKFAGLFKTSPAVFI